MTDHQEPVLFKRTEAPGQLYGGVPNRDLTQADWDRLDPGQRREVKHSAFYVAAGSDELRDPLGELDNAAFEALTPAEKGARTREANKRADEAAKAEAERRKDQEAAYITLPAAPGTSVPHGETAIIDPETVDLSNATITELPHDPSTAGGE